MIKLGVIFGGKSMEHEVSLMSSASVMRTLDLKKFELIKIGITKEGQWKLFDGEIDKVENGEWEKEAVPFSMDKLKDTIDFALPILHGPFGEDGTIQGLFEMLDVPYGGCNVVSSAAAMDKIIAKQIFAKSGLPVCKYVHLIREYFEPSQAKAIGKAVGYPCFVKPANLGSSVGITKAYDEEQLIAAIYEAAEFDRRIVIEENINGREVEVGIIGNETPLASIAGEIVPSADFYDYTAKYFDGGKSELIIPARINEDTMERVRELAVEAYASLDCCGFARVDFLVDKETEEIYINEINTIPGFTKFSMFPLLWAETGVPYKELVERIVDLGYERYYAKNRR